jgi:hypothetical protein
MRAGYMTPARKKLTYKPDAPASESMMAPGIHSLALRARIGFMRIFVAGVIDPLEGSASCSRR